MARGGDRKGAGRKPDPNSKRQQALARKAAKAGEAAAPRASGFTLPNGQKSPDAPPGWPFGTLPPADEPAHPPKVLSAREFLSQVVNDLSQDDKIRIDAAKKLIEFEEPKPAAVGKKDGRRDAAKKAGTGKFGAAPPPLKLVGGLK